MDSVVRYVVRDQEHRTVTLCSDLEQATWMVFLLGRGHYWTALTDRTLLKWLHKLEAKRDAQD